MSQTKYEKLINNIRSLLGILELAENSQLYQDAIAISNYLATSTYQIAVFGPFNHGKSTLLNALLGKKTLPIDLIPTTGAAIYINYGEELKTKITFKDGQEIEQSGTKVLQEYAILDENCRMREDVVNIQVYCHHPFLQTGVEFIDLPGTNDREAQNNLVKNKLLTTDLIIHVLDARKLMTLEERDNLKIGYNNGELLPLFL
jgi:ribosome biogenesis GTPase A